MNDHVSILTAASLITAIRAVLCPITAVEGTNTMTIAASECSRTAGSSVIEL